MPTTINGIGTMYFGKRNLEQYSDTCESCRREGVLQNYETTLWFTFFYIPLLPLGKKQILQECTSCRRHRAASVEQWKRLQEEVLSERSDHASKNPDDANASIELLNAMVAFHRKEEAARIVDVLQQRFPNHVDVRLRLGAWFESAGDQTSADSHFKRALELAPTNLAAKHAVVIGLIQQGNTTAASQLLSADPPLSPKQDPPAYAALADALQKASQFDAALEVYRQLLVAVPAAGSDSGLRKRILACERRAARTETILPTIPLMQRGWFKPSLIGVAVLSVVGFAEYYIANHRTLHIVNGLSEAVEVRLPAGQVVTVSPRGLGKLPIVEGTHLAAVRTQSGDEFNTEVDIASNLFSRLFYSPAYVLNVAGAGIVVSETTVYSDKPNNKESGEFQIHVGRPFVTIDDADYFFEPFPKQLQSENSRVVKSRVGVDQAEPLVVLVGAPDDVSWDDRLAFVEGHLRTVDDMQLTNAYVNVCVMQNQSARARAYLESTLDRKPIKINRHRAYQSLRERDGDRDELIAEYQRRLDREPDSSAWLYLRGRLEPDSAKSIALYDRAIAADPKNSYPSFAKAYRLLSQGDVEDARKSAQAATQANPTDLQMKDFLRTTRLACGEAVALETELRSQLTAAPTLLENYSNLLEVLAVQRKQNDMLALKDSYQAQVRNSDEPQKDDLSCLAAMEFFYLSGNYRQALEESNKLSNSGLKDGRQVLVYLELERLSDAAAVLERTDDAHAYYELLLSMAYRRQGDAAAAARWQSKAIEHLASGDADERAFAALLNRIPEVSAAELRSASLNSDRMVIIVAAFAQQCPKDRAALIDLTEKLNFGRRWHYPQIAKTVAELRAKKD